MIDCRDFCEADQGTRLREAHWSPGNPDVIQGERERMREWRREWERERLTWMARRRRHGIPLRPWLSPDGEAA